MNGDTLDLEVLKELMAKPITTVLTLRDHFALAALASLLHAPRPYRFSEAQAYAELAYRFADAMAAERDRVSSTGSTGG